jgi:mono/diheme cytochrome c family protein
MTAALLFAVLILAPARAAEPGQALFSAAGCRSCHKVGPLGGNTGPDLTFVGFRRSRQWLDLWLASPRAWKKDTLMPEPRLSAAARAGLVEYLSAQKGQAFGARRPWDGAQGLEKGRIIFVKAGCAACHGAGGRGGHPNNNVEGGVIPPLPALVATYTAEELNSKIKRGSRPVKKDAAGPEPLVAMPAWGDVLKDDEVQAVAAYLMTLAEGEKGADW